MKVPEIDEETLKKLPEWHGILREIYEGVEIDAKNEPRPYHHVADQTGK